eukprot:1989458-Rhodomonas_salina.3
MVDTNGNRYAQAAQKHWRMKHGLDDVPVLHPSEAIQSPLDTPLQNLQLREPPTSADLGRLESPPPPPSSAKGRLKLGAFPGAGGESAAGASERGGEERRAAEAGEEGGEEHHPVSSTKDTSIQMRLPMLTPRSSPLTCDACYDKATWFEPSKADGDFTDEQVDYPQVTATPICSESADVVQTSILLLRFSFCVWRRCLLFPGDLRRPVLTHRMFNWRLAVLAYGINEESAILTGTKRTITARLNKVLAVARSTIEASRNDAVPPCMTAVLTRFLGGASGRGGEGEERAGAGRHHAR